YHWTKELLTYVSAAKGFKAGGFNTAAPAGSEAFGPERSWTYEAGVKSTFLDNRLRVNAAYYYIDWEDLQLDTPVASAPGTFFIDHAGKATSAGVEVEAALLVFDEPDRYGSLELFGGGGIINSNFGGGSL